jgi:hypothetical protein
MKYTALLLILATACASAPPPPVAAAGSDDFQIQAALVAVYNVISGPAGRRDWNRFTPLFAPGARLISTRITDGVPVTNVMTPEEFSKNAQTYFAEHGFFERPINNRIERFRDIAQVWSTYESRNASADEKPFARGVNSFQLVRSGDRWLIMTIFWQEEDAAHPIPGEYLPRR